MSSALLCPFLKQSFTDSNGIPLAGGQLFSYAAGTSVPQATYTDSTAVTPNSNPVILDAAGRANVWLTAGSYKFVLEDVLGNVIFTEDNVVAQSNGNGLGNQNTFLVLDNQSSLQNITTMLIDHTVNQSVVIEYTIIRSDGTNKRREHGFLFLTYDTQNGWILNRTFQGADALNMGSLSLQITAGGQVQYESDSMGGTYAGKLTWQIQSAFPAEGI